MLQNGWTLKTIISEINQTQKDTYYTILLIWGTYDRQISKDRKYGRGYQRMRGGRWNGDLLFSGERVSICDEEGVLDMDKSDCCTT
jgi:hypothetical protein